MPSIGVLIISLSGHANELPDTIANRGTNKVRPWTSASGQKASPTGSYSVEIARAIHVARPTLPLVLLAGYFDHNVLEKFDEVSILQKPYTEDDLIKSIRATLHQGSC
jgi:hypothetical protein